MASLTQFVAARQGTWTRLEELLARGEGNGVRRLSPGELDELGQTYRRVMSDLAVAQRDFPDDQVTHWLNGLAARAHLRLYRAPRGSWRRLARFFWTDFARRFRQAWRYMLLAAALFFLPALWAYFGALFDPTIRTALVPAEMRTVMERGRTWTDIEAVARPAVTAFIFTNNVRVSFLAFAGGVLFGVGTVLVLVLNGLSIGAVLGAAQHYGVGHLLWAFVSPHGYLEITSILIAAAAGLMLGDGLLRPGFLRRRDALTQAGRQSLQLVLGAAPVFVIAGLVEGFISPSGLPAEVKYALGPVLGLVLWALLLRIGRRHTSRPF